MTCPEIIKLLKDVILAGVAIFGAFVALKGLNTWQRQLKGQSEYELSRRILVTLYKYRDAIYGLRHPAMWVEEMPSPPEDESEKMNRDQISYYGTSKAYQKRWDKVQIERTSLSADILEAEVIWGEQLKEFFKKVFKLEHELLISIRHYLELINPDAKEASKEAIIKLDKKRRDIMYDDLSEEGDEFKNDLLSAIQNIEKYLKPKLSNKKV